MAAKVQYPLSNFVLNLMEAAAGPHKHPWRRSYNEPYIRNYIKQNLSVPLDRDAPVGKIVKKVNETLELAGILDRVRASPAAPFTTRYLRVQTRPA